MDRSKRSSDQENETWANPCDYNVSVLKSSLSYTSDLSYQVAAQARNTREKAEAYKDEFAEKIHGYKEYSRLLSEWTGYPWMYRWFNNQDDVRNDMYRSNVSEDDLVNLMPKIDTVLPSMYKGLKMVVAGLYAVSEDLPTEDNNLKLKMVNTSRDVRAVLCLFNDVMRSRKLMIKPLLDSEIPEWKYNNRYEDSMLMYRDTLNYLEYLEQVFDKLGSWIPE